VNFSGHIFVAYMVQSFELTDAHHRKSHDPNR